MKQQMQILVDYLAKRDGKQSVFVRPKPAEPVLEPAVVKQVQQVMMQDKNSGGGFQGSF